MSGRTPPPGFAPMALELLQVALAHAHDPAALAEVVTGELRELTGAGIVALLECRHATEECHEVLAAEPERRRAILDGAAAQELSRLIPSLAAPALWQPGDAAAGELLAALGVGPSIGAPLRIAETRVGALLLLDLPDLHDIELVMALLKPLADVLALALRNALLLREREQLAARATAERDTALDRLAGLVEAAPAAVIALDLEGRVTEWNPAAERIFGWRREEALGQPNPIVPEASWEEFRAGAARTLAGEALHGVELVRRRKDGSPVTVRVSNTLLRDEGGEAIGFLGILEDVSRERELAARTERLLATTLDGYILADTAGRIRQVNPAYCAMVGYEPDELLAMTIHQLEAQLDDAAIERLIPEMVAAGGARFETRHRRKDGEVVDLDVSITILDQPDGPLVAAFVRDVTEDRRARAALRASEARFRTLTTESPVGIFLDDAEGRAIYLNDRCAELVGLPPDRALGFDWVPSIHPDDRERVTRQWADAVERGELFHAEYRWVHADGRVVWTLGKVAPVRGDGDEVICYVGTLTDITERKAAEAALERSRARLEVLYELDTAILEARSVEEVAGATLERLADLIPCHRASVAVFDEAAGAAVVYARGVAAEEIGQGRSVPLAGTFSDLERLRRGEVVAMPDLDALGELDGVLERLRRDGVLSAVNVPLRAHGELLGSLNLGFDRRHAFSDEDVEVLREVAGSLAVAVEQTNLHEVLDAHAHDLEAKVAERTAELRRAVDLMAGREIRMAELKDVIKRLRAQLRDLGIEPEADDPLAGARAGDGQDR